MRERILRQGAQEMGLDLTDFQVSSLLGYLDLLQKWNKAYNLTAIRNELEMVRLHLLDSLTVVPFIGDGPVADIGTGAGLPGVVIAIMKPDCRVVMVDSNIKKVNFVRQAIGQLGLKNAQVTHTRVEELSPEPCFKQITSRAFASLEDMIDWTQHLVCPEGEFLAMKGQTPSQEIQTLSERFQIESHPLSVPGELGERCLVVLKHG